MPFFPVAVVAGFQNPLLIGLAGVGRDGIATDVGALFAVNTAGTITGSLLGGFYLLPALGAIPTWSAAGTLLLAVSAMIALAVIRRPKGSALPVRERVGVTLALGIGLLAAWETTASGPTALWRHEAIGAGRAHFAPGHNRRLAAVHGANRVLLAEYDGRETTLGLMTRNGLSLAINGKSDGNAITDQGTTLGLGLFGAFLHPEPRRAFVVGLGTGQTAGVLGKVDTIESVRVVEFEEKLLEVLDHIPRSHDEIKDNPKVDIVIADAREELLTAEDDSFDLIVSEPSNPYRAGVSAFFTEEFYASAKKKLRAGGIFVQWLQAYEVSEEVVAIVLSTLKSSFPHVAVMTTQPLDYLVLASDQPLVADVEKMQEKLARAPFREVLSRVHGIASVEGFLARIVAPPETVQAVVEHFQSPTSTDDHMRVEYLFAKQVGRPGLDPGSLGLLADRLGHQMPVRGEVDYRRVKELKGRDRLWFGLMPPPEYRRTPIQRLAAAAVGAGHATIHKERTLAHDDDIVLGMLLARYDVGHAVEATDALLRRLDALSLHFPNATAWAAVTLRRRVLERAHRTRTATRSAVDDSAAPAPALEELEEAYVRAVLRALAGSRTERYGLRSCAREMLAVGRQKLCFEHASQLLSAVLEGPLTGYAAERMRWQAAFALATKHSLMATCTRLARQLEPHVGWEESILVNREACYRATGAPLADRARADLEAYRASQPSEAFDRIQVGPP